MVPTPMKTRQLKSPTSLVRSSLSKGSTRKVASFVHYDSHRMILTAALARWQGHAVVSLTVLTVWKALNRRSAKPLKRFPLSGVSLITGLKPR